MIPYFVMYTYGNVYPQTVDCLIKETCIQTIKMFREPGYKFYAKTMWGDADLGRARARATASFLATDANVLIQFDRDLIWPADKDVFCDLANYAYENNCITGLAVTHKSFSGATCCKFLEPFDVFDEANYDRFIECDFVGGSCLVIPRKIIEEVNAKCPQGLLPFTPAYAPFVREADGLYLTDDWAFCERAHQLGYKCYAKLIHGISHTGDFNYSFDNRFEFRE